MKKTVKGTFGRPHIAKYLLKKYPDKFASVRDVFDKLIGRGKKAYLDTKGRVSIKDGIKIIKEAEFKEKPEEKLEKEVEEAKEEKAEEAKKIEKGEINELKKEQHEHIPRHHPPKLPPKSKFQEQHPTAPKSV